MLKQPYLMFCFQMVGSIAIAIDVYGTEHPNTKHKIVQYWDGVRYSIPHCSLVFKWSTPQYLNGSEFKWSAWSHDLPIKYWTQWSIIGMVVKIQT